MRSLLFSQVSLLLGDKTKPDSDVKLIGGIVADTSNTPLPLIWRYLVSQTSQTITVQVRLSQSIEANRQSTSSGNVISWHWTADHCEHVRLLQNALIKLVKTFDPLIEVCVTSNMRIGSLHKPEHHPLKKFLNAGLHVCVATDNPDIFAIDLADEEKFLKSQFGCDDETLRAFEAVTQRWLQADLGD